MYVKANDGISLNIYEGETVGLVGESGCGKSTFGRTLLQLYRQTDGKTMYYGASRDELAPEYIEKTIRHLPHGLHELAALEKKRDEMQKVYDAADEQKRLHMHNDLTAAEKVAAHDKLVEAARAEIAKVDARIDAMRAKYAADPEFQKHEALLDNGIDLARLTYPEVRTLRSQMQYIFQDPYSSLNPRMTVANIIGEGLLAHKYCKKANERMHEEILQTMEDCGLAPYFLHRYPHQFSGGQRQRIGIARSLAVHPKFVVCDEAVSALDVSIQSQIINLLQDLKEQQHLTYLFITHDLSVVKYISDRIGVMYLGNLVELADSQEIFDHPMHPYTEALLESIPTTEEKRDLAVLEGDIPSPVNPPKGCKFHTRCKYCTEICTHVVPDWEEVTPNHFVACHHKLHTNE